LAAGVALSRHAAAVGGLLAFVVALAGLLVLPAVPTVVATAATSWNAMTAGAGDRHLSPLTIGLLSVALGGVWCLLGISGRVVYQNASRGL
jgi:hypothetical protein